MFLFIDFFSSLCICVALVTGIGAINLHLNEQIMK